MTTEGTWEIRVKYESLEVGSDPNDGSGERGERTEGGAG